MVVLNCFGGATYAERIKRCASDLKAWYSRPINRGRQRLNGKLTAERVRAQGDWPKLKAKAAAARHMAYYALDLCRRFAQIDSLNEFTRVNDRLCLGVVQLLVEFYDILNSESDNLSASARARLPDLANDLAGMYCRLSASAYNRGLRLWKVSPKLHLFLHICIHQAPVMGNPRFWWGYGDEDLVKWMIQIAHSVHPSTVAVAVLTKWLWCVFDQVLIEPEDIED